MPRHPNLQCPRQGCKGSRSMLAFCNRFLASALLLLYCGTCASVVTQTTNSEIEAIINLAQSIFPSQPQQMDHAWYVNIDPCGAGTCEPANRTKCAWTGVTCNSWHITGIQIQPSLYNSPAVPEYEPGSLSSHLGDLPQLSILQLANLGLTGPIPPALGTLSKLQTVDLSSNQLSHFLPDISVEMPDLTTLNLSNNRLVGAVPASWDKLSSLTTLDLTNNAFLCNPLPNLTTLSPASVLDSTFPPCTPRMEYAQAAFNATPVVSLDFSPSPSPTPAESSPAPASRGPSSAYHMSSGINVSVSVLVGLCFLLGLCAGFVRIRQQQRRHRAMMSGLNQQRHNFGQWRGGLSPVAHDSQLDPMTAANNPFCGTPRLVLGPDGQHLTLARKLKQQDPEGAGQGSPLSEGLSDTRSSPFGSLFPSHQTKLYTAVLEVQNAADSTAAAPQPVDLVGTALAMDVSTAPRNHDSPTEASHTQAAALQTEAEPSRPTAGGGYLQRVSQSLSRLSFRGLPPNHDQDASVQPPAAVQPSTSADAEAGQASEQQLPDASQRWWWQFWR